MAESLLVRASACGPASRCGRGTVGCRGKAPLTPHFPAAPLIPFTEQGFQDPPGLLLPSPWLQEEVGGLHGETVGASPLPLLLQLTPTCPFSPFHRLGPIPAALAGRGRKMVANEEGEWRELEPGPPLPHFLLCFYTRFWKELGGGVAPRPKVGEGSCWLLNCWSPLSGMV